MKLFDRTRHYFVGSDGFRKEVAMRGTMLDALAAIALLCEFLVGAAAEAGTRAMPMKAR